MPGFGAAQAVFNNFWRKSAHNSHAAKCRLASLLFLRLNTQNNNYT
jgi:hypothetical protein